MAGTTYGFEVKQLTLGTEPYEPLAHDPGLEIHFPIMSNLGDSGDQFERERPRKRDRERPRSRERDIERDRDIYREISIYIYIYIYI